jgi:hypothetical protein
MFETIYRWFIPFYGSDLGKHLGGWDVDAGAFTKTDIFTISGIIVLVTTLFTGATYYYIYDHPRLNRRWKWLLFWLMPVTLVNFFAAFSMTYTDVLAENVSRDLLAVYWYSCLGFGFANIIVSATFFIIISSIIKWGSRNSKYSPF